MHNVRYRDVRPHVNDVVPVPCGKCIHCLQNRQSALVSRCLEESEKRGTFIFMTLTYNDDYLPLAQSLWRVSKETGLYECVSKGEVIVSARSSRLSGLKLQFKDVAEDIRKAFLAECPNSSAGYYPRYFETEIKAFEDDEYIYINRISPSVCREDVRLWLKRARVGYERKYGNKLSDFTYVAVSEYGPKTCRPHYHLAFFGLSVNEAVYLSDSWQYGYRTVKQVNKVNADGSDGFSIASKYIGKYMTKGKFDCMSVKDCSAEKPRICQSNGIGASLIDKIKGRMCAFDMFGEYDLDTLFCPSLGRCLNESELNQLCVEIPKRLSYCIGVHPKSGKEIFLSIPRLFRNKVFYKEYLTYGKCRKFNTSSVFRVSSEELENEQKIVQKKVLVPSTLWSLVADSIRSNLDEDNRRKFEAYCATQRKGTFSSVVNGFAFYESACIESSEKTSEARFVDFLSRSNF